MLRKLISSKSKARMTFSHAGRREYWEAGRVVVDVGNHDDELRGGRVLRRVDSLHQYAVRVADFAIQLDGCPEHGWSVRRTRRVDDERSQTVTAD